jgi:hypothetical protein
MKFELPGLAAAMALRGLDVEALVEAASDAGRPVGSDTVRKALRGLPVSMVSATRIAAVLRTRQPIPRMADLLGSSSESVSSVA